MLSARAQWVGQHERYVMGRANVVGWGWGSKRVGHRPTSQEGMVVFVRRKVPLAELAARDVVPGSVGARPTDVIEVGDVHLLRRVIDTPVGNPWVSVDGSGPTNRSFGQQPSPPVDRSARWRPAPPGVSIGHIHVTAGTFGACVQDRKTGDTLILSNNHVCANGTDGTDDKSRVGDLVFQPGRYDGGTESDVIGHLERFIPLHPMYSAPGCPWAQRVQRVLNWPLRLIARRYTVELRRMANEDNIVDCALVRPVNPDAIDPKIVGVGRVQGTAEAEVGMAVKKSGRTTGVTYGEVMALGATMHVGLGGDAVARFVDQIVTTPLAQPGDSGSLVLGPGNRAVGLLFAGSDKSTLCNRISAVCEALDVRI